MPAAATISGENASAGVLMTAAVTIIDINASVGVLYDHKRNDFW